MAPDAEEVDACIRIAEDDLALLRDLLNETAEKLRRLRAIREGYG